MMFKMMTGVDVSVHISTPFDVQVEVEDEEHASITLKMPDSVKKVQSVLKI